MRQKVHFIALGGKAGRCEKKQHPRRKRQNRAKKNPHHTTQKRNQQRAGHKRSQIKRPNGSFDEVPCREGVRRRIEWIAERETYPGKYAAKVRSAGQPKIETRKNVLAGQPDSILI